MNPQALQTSYAVEAVSRALAEWTVVAHAEQDATLAQRYGGSWRRDWVADAHARILYLCQALAVERPELLAHMCRWVASARPKDTQVLDDLQTSLRCCTRVVAEQLPGQAGSIAGTYLEGAAESLARPLPDPPPQPPADAPHPDLRLRLLEALLSADRDRARREVDQALRNGLALTDLYLHVLRPTLFAVGEMWHSGEISVADEHFATEAIRDLLARARTRFPETPARRTRIVTCGVSGDLHDVGLRIVTDLFELHGWPTTYLGANLPAADLVTCLGERDAGLLALSMSTCMHVRTGGETIAAIRAARPDTRIIVGGYPFQLIPELATDLGADGVAHCPSDALRLAEQWFPHA